MTDAHPTEDASHMQTTLGPYERWMADFGKDYDLPTLMLGKPTYLSCLAQFATPQQGPMSPGRFADHGIDVRSLGPWVPTHAPAMWPGPEGREFKYRFLPLLLETPGSQQDSGTPFSAETFEMGLNQLASAYLHHENARISSLENAGFSPVPEDIRNLLDSIESGTTDERTPPVFKVGFPLDATSVVDDPIDMKPPAKPQPDRSYDPAKPLVIMAVIDDGIPFAHSAFRCRESRRTRIDYYWNQSAKKPSETPVGPGPSVLFGREFPGHDIDRLTDQLDGEEDVIYRNAGVLGGRGMPVSSLAGAYSHGAHVAGLAAGDWPEDCEANVRIIAVDLPVSSSWDTSGYGKDMFVLSAMHYIFDRADRIAEAYGVSSAPLIVNLSYGYSGGPKDGTGLIEQAMGEMIRHRRTAMKAPTALVMPSGNMFLDRLHAVVTEEHISGSKTAKLPWSISHYDRTSSFMEIWLPTKVDPVDFRFVLKTPAGDSVVDTKDVDDMHFFKNIHVGGDRVGQFSIDRPGHADVRREDGSALLQSRVMIAIAPTETLNRLPAAPAGHWQVEISYAPGRDQGGLSGHASNIFGELVPADIRCWIQRDVSFGNGNTGAKQSFFDDPLNSLYDELGRRRDIDSVWRPGFLVRRFGSLNGMSTHRTVMVVGGYIESEHRVAPYSSAGSLRKNDETEWALMAGDQVNCVAACERSSTTFGISSIGTRSGTFFAMNGTSVAAPQVSRKLALSFIDKPVSTTGPDEVGNELEDTADYVARPKPEMEDYKAKNGTIKQKDKALIGSGFVLRKKRLNKK